MNHLNYPWLYLRNIILITGILFEDLLDFIITPDASVNVSLTAAFSDGILHWMFKVHIKRPNESYQENKDKDHNHTNKSLENTTDLSLLLARSMSILRV